MLLHLLRRVCVFCALLVLHVMSAASAQAGLLALDFSGGVGPGSTLNGVLLDVNTGFSFSAVFDPTMNQGSGFGAFAVTQFTISIVGHGTYMGVTPSPTLFVAITTSTGDYSVGLIDSPTDPSFGFYGVFEQATPPVDPEAPTPTVFSELSESNSSSYTIDLVGGGSLVINRPVSVSGASIAAIPEPSTLQLSACASVIGFTVFLRRRNSSRARIPAGAR